MAIGHRMIVETNGWTLMIYMPIRVSKMNVRQKLVTIAMGVAITNRVHRGTSTMTAKMMDPPAISPMAMCQRKRL